MEDLNKKFEVPVAVDFRSRIVGKDFYTLDGEKQVMAPTYSKFISSLEDLCVEEREELVRMYVQQRQVIRELVTFTDKLRL